MIEGRKISISFGLISFYFGLLIFIHQYEPANIIIGMIYRLLNTIFIISLIEFFLYILFSGAFYKVTQKGFLDKWKMNINKKDVLFDDALSWSFIGIFTTSILFVFNSIYSIFLELDFTSVATSFHKIILITIGIIASFIYVVYIFSKITD